MQQIFINEEPVGGKFHITGADAHHLIRAVRMKRGEKLRVSTGAGNNYLCAVEEAKDADLVVSVIEEVSSTELTCKIRLFQAIPKGDRMDFIIEKCVELGVYEIIPVQMKNCVVRLDEKRAESRVARYQTIAEAAAKQSKRSVIPMVHSVMDFKAALDYAKASDLILMPYENKNGIAETFDALCEIKAGMDIAVFIGPEGGFDGSEVELARDRARLISLGKRILRTDTAAITTMSLLMLYCEKTDDIL